VVVVWPTISIPRSKIAHTNKTKNINEKKKKRREGKKKT
jgi:hypothetical protein